MILTPRYLAGVADGVVDIFAQTENEILADIARKIIKTGGVTNTAGWQMQKMREAGMLNENTVKQLATATNRSEAEIQKMLKDSYKRALYFDIDVIPADLQMSWSQIKDNPAFRAIMLQGVNNANQLVNNFTKTTAGAAQVAFFNSLDVSYLQYVTGAVTREDAVRSALKKLSQDGIYKVAYPQQNGGTYYSSVESAVRRALTTAVNQSCAKLQLANCDVLGTDLVETTAHLGARPSHAVWQGKVFSRTGSTSKYPNFEESTGYGTGDGLCGWNCRHSFFPFFEGYSKSAYETGKFDSEENARLYENEQKQRRYERMVREAKREVSTLQAGFDAADSAELQEGLAADLQQAKTKLRNRQKLLREHCQDHGLYNDYSRTYTAGYNGKKNRTNISKTVDNSGKSGIIKVRNTKEKTIARNISSIEQPIEQRNTGKGNPNAVLIYGAELNNRQKGLLAQLKEYDSRVTVSKKSVSMSDLSALTAYTGDEFAMFTKSGERLIIRGDSVSVNIVAHSAQLLADQGYRWSGHTHPGTDFECMTASSGDMKILRFFKQTRSAIYNSKGQFITFERK